MSDTRFLTVQQMAEQNQQKGQWPDRERSLRHLIFHAETNGFNKCIRRAGRRVLIDGQAFYAWLQNEGSVAA